MLHLYAIFFLHTDMYEKVCKLGTVEEINNEIILIYCHKISMTMVSFKISYCTIFGILVIIWNKMPMWWDKVRWTTQATTQALWHILRPLLTWRYIKRIIEPCRFWFTVTEADRKQNRAGEELLLSCCNNRRSLFSLYKLLNLDA